MSFVHAASVCRHVGKAMPFCLPKVNIQNERSSALEGAEFSALIGAKAFDADWIIKALNERGAKIIISQRPQRNEP